MPISQRAHPASRAPAPRPFESIERLPRPPPTQKTRDTWLQTLNPFSADAARTNTFPSTSAEPKRDIARGMEAAKRVVTEGKLDARYRAHSRRVLSVMVALPIAIVGGWELYQRVVMGKVPKQIVGIGPAVGEGYK